MINPERSALARAIAAAQKLIERPPTESPETDEIEAEIERQEVERRGPGRNQPTG